MPIPIPKPQRLTKEERQAERRSRDANPFKPVFAKKEKPERIAGTSFSKKPGKKRLMRVYLVADRKVKTVQRKPMAKGKALKFQGHRGKRLAPGDRKAAASIKGLPCICGCNRHPLWVHLKTRGSEALRHLDWVTIAGCGDLDFWLDQGPGAAVKAELFALAESLQRRLTEADIGKALSGNGYYTWLVDKRTII